MALKRAVSSELTLYVNRNFPKRFKARKKYRHRVTLGIGGNIGDVARRFHRLVLFLQRDHRVEVLQTAPILQNPPFGFKAQEDFLNSVLEVSTSMTPQQLLRYILHVEQKFGRRRSFPNAPRTLDIDMIFFDALQIKSRHLTLPHPCWQERASVLIPLSLLGRCR